MSLRPEYIKDIEDYFISLAGEGIMLSSIDYDLIRGWRDRDIPRDVVFMGIKRAFSDRGHRNRPGGGTIRGLRHCAGYVEKCAGEYGVGAGPAPEKGYDPKAHGGESESIPERLGRLIESENDGVARRYYINLRTRILALGEGDDEARLMAAGEIEEQALEELFGTLPGEERDAIMRDAENMIGVRARHMTGRAFRESLTSFRNEIVSKKYSIKSVM